MAEYFYPLFNQGLLLNINIAIKKNVTKGKLKSLLDYQEEEEEEEEEEEAILKLMADPKCGVSMRKSLESQLQKGKKRIRKIIRS